MESLFLARECRSYIYNLARRSDANQSRWLGEGTKSFFPSNIAARGRMCERHFVDRWNMHREQSAILGSMGLNYDWRDRLRTWNRLRKLSEEHAGSSLRAKLCPLSV